MCISRVKTRERKEEWAHILLKQYFECCCGNRYIHTHPHPHSSLALLMQAIIAEHILISCNLQLLCCRPIAAAGNFGRPPTSAPLLLKVQINDPIRLRRGREGGREGPFLADTCKAATLAPEGPLRYTTAKGRAAVVSTEQRKSLGTWLREIPSCFCLTFLPGSCFFSDVYKCQTCRRVQRCLENIFFENMPT